MGNYRFKLSDMLPNAWFQKLKYTTSTKHNEEHHHHHPPKPAKKSAAKQTTTSSSMSSSLLQPSLPSHNHIIAARQQPHLSEQRKSYYFTRDLTTNNPSPSSPTKPEKKAFNVVVEATTTPRKSASRRRRNTRRSSARHGSPRLVSSSISAGCSCRATFESVWTKMDDSMTTPVHPTSSSSDHDSVLPEFGSGRDDNSPASSWSTSCNCSVRNDSFISDNDEDNTTKESNLSDASELITHRIPPIVTKKKSEPTKILHTSTEIIEEKTRRRLSVKVVREETTNTTSSWSSSSTTSATKNSLHKSIATTSTSPVRLRLSSAASAQSGVRLRTNSPRMKIQARRSVSSSSARRGGVSESFAVVKSSRDPKKDFRKSMVEMIVENDIRKSKDLEELLACYLSLNSNEYHDLIINVFKQIWFDFVQARLK